MEAYAALRSIVRRDTGEGYQAFLAQLAVTSRIATPTLLDLQQAGFRSYIGEPARRPHRWRGPHPTRDAVHTNRRRIRGAPGLALLRRRGELLERTFAHAYTTGAMRRTHLRGHADILNWAFVHLGAFDLGLLMRQLVGVGTPRGLQDRAAAVRAALVGAWRHLVHARVPGLVLDALIV